MSNDDERAMCYSYVPGVNALEPADLIRQCGRLVPRHVPESRRDETPSSQLIDLLQFYREIMYGLKPIKDATVNRDLSVLRHILYWAVDEQLLEANPLARLKMARERRTRRQVLSLAEETSLLAAAPPHLLPMIIAALDTGMRRGEITNQRWEDIDPAMRLLFVTRSKTGDCREIPLTRRLFEWLSEHRRDQGIVFAYEGEQVHFIQRSWKTALRNAGIRHVRFHDLRHTFNTRLMEAGVMQEVRMALMGHSTGSKVHSIYTHVELPVKREAIARLEQWVITQTQTQGGQHASTETGLAKLS